MVAPAVIAAAIQAAPAIMKGVQSLGSMFGGNKNTQLAKAYQAYAQQFGNNLEKTLENRGKTFENKLIHNFNQGEGEFLNEANTQLPELQNLMNDIATQNTETQRGDLRRINAVLAQQGVRGGQAAILANRALGETSRDAMRDINKLAYDDAARRQGARLNYFTNKAQTPYNTLNSTYGGIMGGAYGALNGAQGAALSSAYNAQLGNYGNTLKTKKKFGIF